jgi:serine/threonine protein kinase
MSTEASKSMISSIRGSFGSWPMDKDVNDVYPYRSVHLSARRFIAIFQDKYAIKFFDDGVEVLAKELRMMILAGDCSVTPLGRVFRDGKICGILMPYEQPVVPSLPDLLYTPRVSPSFSRDDKLNIINQLCTLVSRLHDKGIVHGDVKPSNLLLCSNGELRFCDFGEANMQAEKVPPHAISVRYASPFMCRTIPIFPLSEAEDRYATGMSIWEIFTGRIPFEDVDEDLVEDVIGAGVRPDLTLVDDATVAGLIVTYLDSGDRSLQENIFLQARESCIATDFTFQACLASPPHTYRKVIRCEACVQAKIQLEIGCSYLYTTPPVTDTSSTLICTRCRPVEYQGL